MSTPATADGVEIVVGMTVWTLDGQPATVTEVCCESDQFGRNLVLLLPRTLTDFCSISTYSTRLAALRAREREILDQLAAVRTVLWAEERTIKQRIMEEGKERLRAIFGVDSEFVEEWDVYEGAEHAICHVLTDLSVEEAREKLDRFDDEWWLKHPDLGMVCFDFRFEDADRR